MDEKVVETRTCRQCRASFSITDRDMGFYVKVSPVIAGKKEIIPPPTLCPECRQQRRLAFRNERSLYHRKCDITDADIISIHAPTKTYPVCDQDVWWTDRIDPLAVGRDFDFTRPFFPQFSELLRHVPQCALIAFSNENSKYCNHTGYNKNCYLCFDAGWCEDSFHITRSYKNISCMDLYSTLECERSYELVDCVRCTDCAFCQSTEGCNSCRFCVACRDCHDCMMCVNLVNQSYCIENKKYSKEEYQKKVSELSAKPFHMIQSEFRAFVRGSIHRSSNNLSCENVSGDYLKECSNTYDSYDSHQCRDSRFGINSVLQTDSYDDHFSGNNGSLCIETIGCERPTGNRFCFACWQGNTDILYSYFCHTCHDCLGCVGLQNKAFCIFNKQYTKEEYEKIVPKIIEHMRSTGEWGEFFPVSVSLFGYNETVAQEYFPMTREEALTKGFNWSDYEPPFPQVSRTIPADRLPDRIEDIPDDILNWAIVCEVTGKPFRIIKQELEFYRKHHLPIPHRHPDQRHLDRMSLRNPRKLFERKCDKCQEDMRTTYAPERPEKVYCEKCYNREVYG